jgi:serine phosphatase RsbU (regulator of sigma subunit)
MRDESGQLTHFVSVSQDITELRKKQEQEFQLQLARDVQQRFCAAAPAVSGFDIGASSHPADETGGDYFDFISMSDGSLVIAVADAKGHGFSSALVMHSLGPTCAASPPCSWNSMKFWLGPTRCC